MQSRSVRRDRGLTLRRLTLVFLEERRHLAEDRRPFPQICQRSQRNASNIYQYARSAPHSNIANSKV